MSHTDGPWWACPPDEDSENWEIEDGYGHTATVYGDDEPAAANARLMAAAPDLLAALDSIRSSLMELDDDGCGRPGCGWREMDATHVDELISNSLRLAIDVIAKAEGRE
jgi:hypothetical protein